MEIEEAMKGYRRMPAYLAITDDEVQYQNRVESDSDIKDEHEVVPLVYTPGKKL